MQGSRYLGQYSPGSPGWVERPAELPSTDMTGAFEQGTGPVAAPTPPTPRPTAVSTAPVATPTTIATATTATPATTVTATATATATATLTAEGLGPHVTIQVDDDEIDPGDSVDVTVIAVYGTGIDWIEWEGVREENENDNTSPASDPELAGKEYDCNGTPNCANDWSVKPTVPGQYELRARAKGEDGVLSEWVTTRLKVRTPNATATPTAAASSAPTSTQTPTP
jgi:hypothetical protein